MGAHIEEMRNAYTWTVNLKGRVHAEVRRTWEDDIRTDLREIDGKVWIECIWLRTRTSGGLLWTL